MRFLARRFLTAGFSAGLFVVVVSSASGGGSQAPASQTHSTPAPTAATDKHAAPNCQLAHGPSVPTQR